MSLTRVELPVAGRRTERPGAPRTCASRPAGTGATGRCASSAPSGQRVLLADRGELGGEVELDIATEVPALKGAQRRLGARGAEPRGARAGSLQVGGVVDNKAPDAPPSANVAGTSRGPQDSSFPLSVASACPPSAFGHAFGVTSSATVHSRPERIHCPARRHQVRRRPASVAARPPWPGAPAATAAVRLSASSSLPTRPSRSGVAALRGARPTLRPTASRRDRRSLVRAVGGVLAVGPAHAQFPRRVAEHRCRRGRTWRSPRARRPARLKWSEVGAAGACRRITSVSAEKSRGAPKGTISRRQASLARARSDLSIDARPAGVARVEIDFGHGTILPVSKRTERGRPRDGSPGRGRAGTRRRSERPLRSN